MLVGQKVVPMTAHYNNIIIYNMINGRINMLPNIGTSKVRHVYKCWLSL